MNPASSIIEVLCIYTNGILIEDADVGASIENPHLPHTTTPPPSLDLNIFINGIYISADAYPDKTFAIAAKCASGREEHLLFLEKADAEILGA